MALHQSRLLLMLASLPLVGIFGYLWLKKKEDDEEDSDSPEQCEEISSSNTSLDKNLEVTSIESPTKVFSRSLSGTTSTPIDIVIPRQLRAHKSAPVFISDEDLDLEIEKIKSMKNNNYQWKEGSTAEPVKEESTHVEVEATRATLMPASPMEKATTSATKMSPKSTKSSPKSSPVSTKSSPKSSSPKYKSPKVIKCTPQKTILSSSTSPKDQKQAKSVEEQFNSLQLSPQKQTPPKESPTKENHTENEEMQRQSSERDSANHSPCDVMLASPAPSSISDNQSEGSNDSGKGGSDVATPPSQTPANDGSISGDVVDIPIPVIYQFTIPQHFVGRLIGRGGSVIQDIKSKSHTNILVKKHPGNTKLKICAIEGTQMEVDNALHHIRERFPLKKYPEITLEQIIVAPPPLPPDQLGLRLIEGINNDTMVSAIMEPNRFFIQFPTHPSFPALNILSNNMSAFYNTNETPTLPLPIADFTICACQLDGFWYRVMVSKTDAETDTSHVTLLDYGGSYWVENSRLRQISGDFLLLPFQATECILANIRPIGGGTTWPKEAFDAAAELANRALACTQVADYTSNGIPLVYMYIVAGHQDIVFLNQELVDRGFAEWISYSQVETRTTART